MAIIKPYETPHGVTALYHKILKADIDCVALTIQVVTAIYATKEARDAGKGALWHEYQTVPFSALTQDPRDLLYPMMAAYWPSYLHAGQPSDEGFAQPGNSTIQLKEEAMLPPPVDPAPQDPDAPVQGDTEPVEPPTA